MHTQKKYKSDLKKYRTSELEKCNNISVQIWQSDRADLVNMCPDFDFFLKRLDVFIHNASGILFSWRDNSS